MRPLLFVFAAFLLGSVCAGPWLARARGVDLRAHGSGNIGATNVGRVLGAKAGRLVLLLDAGKGLIAVGLAQRLGEPPEIVFAVGIAVVLGHVLSVFERFRGGKGAATALGALLALDPPVFAIAGATYALVKRATGYASAGTLSGVAVASLVHPLLRGVSWTAAAVWSISLVVLATHRANVRRLLRGEELRA